MMANKWRGRKPHLAKLFECQSICFFCGAQEIQKGENGILEQWKSNAAGSLCKTFGFSSTDDHRGSMMYIFSKANFCSECSEAVGNLDFTIRSLEKLENQKLSLKLSLADRLRVNPQNEKVGDSVDFENFGSMLTFSQVVGIVYSSKFKILTYYIVSNRK